MKNILIARGNPRKEGYTQQITDMVAQGATEAGATVVDIDLLEKQINPCLGCYRCWTNGNGRCVQNDDMQDLLDHLQWADVLLCATPLYNYMVSASMKLFLERTFPIMEQGIEKTPKGLFRNKLRNPSQWDGKKMALLCVGALRKKENFSGALASFKLLADGLHMEYAGALIRPESYLLQFSLAKPKTIKSIEMACMQGGRDLALRGYFSKESMKKVSLPLSRGEPHFEKYSNIYWQHTMRLAKSNEFSLQMVQEAVVKDVTILLNEMVSSYDPLTTAKVKASISIEFSDINKSFLITIHKGECSLVEDVDDKTADLQIVTDRGSWIDLFLRKKEAKELLFERKIQLKGDKRLFTKFERYFPPPAS